MAETWIEASGKEGLKIQLRQQRDTMGLSRLIEEVHRLFAMCNAFIKHTANSKETENVVRELPEAQSTN